MIIAIGESLVAVGPAARDERLHGDVIVAALLALALVAGVWVALHGYELIWWREARAQLRAQRLPGSP